ncbi:MAG: sporulation initiation factor Spo0A C-terminal domain-containing protein [Clostridia bacterium]|nr:sporulation initiation factor Spo0A C-terminal domain-containing protein [Clostridia bacterium]
MNTKEIEMKKMLIQMGVSPELKGYHYLAEAITMQRDRFDEGKVVKPCMEVYADIAKAHNDTASRVERAMRHAIERAFSHYNEALEDLFHALIDLDSGKVSNSCFICTMAEHFAFQKGARKNGIDR